MSAFQNFNSEMHSKTLSIDLFFEIFLILLNFFYITFGFTLNNMLFFFLSSFFYSV